MLVNQFERWMRLALGTVVLLFAGVIYAWSVLRVPFAAEFGWDAGQLSVNYTLTIVAFSISGFVAGLLTNKTTPRLRILVAAVLLFTGFFLTSRLSGESIVALYLAYGVMSGAGVGCAYTTIIGMTSAWFPDMRGLCSGVLLFAFGLTTLVIGNIANAMINMPEIGWRTTFLVLAVAEGVVLGLGSLFIRAPKEGTVFPEPKATKEAAATAAANAPAAASVDYTLREVIRRPSFWKLFFFLIFLASVGSAAIGLAGNILGELGVADPAAIIGIISVFNSIGRLTSGALYDNLGLRRTQFVMSGVAIAAPLTVVVAVLTGSLAIGMVGLCLCFFSYGFSPTTSSVFASSFYGMKNFSMNFGVLNLILIPAPFATTMAGFLFTSTGSFLVPFAILTCGSLVGLVLNISIREA